MLQRLQEFGVMLLGLPSDTETYCQLQSSAQIREIRCKCVDMSSHVQLEA